MRAWRAGCFLLLLTVPAVAQKLNPVQWTLKVDERVAPGGQASATLQAVCDPGWHIYSLTTPLGGPTPTVLKADLTRAPKPGDAAAPATPEILPEKLRARWHQPKPAEKFDPNFKTDTEVFSGTVIFPAILEVGSDVAPGKYRISVLTRFQACTETECLPRKVTVVQDIVVDPRTPRTTVAIPAGMTEFTGTRTPRKTAAASAPTSASSSDQAAPPEDLLPFMLVAFGFGVAAIFTPCVFPMIPITLSYFLNKKLPRGQMLQQAALFCLGIVVVFSGLGLAVSAILGPFGVVQIGANPWVNGFIALVFLVFGLSLLGAFEITLPSAFLTRVDKASERGGITGTLLMGLTFSLTSFACVGPFVGTLLAGSVSRGGWQPAVGMITFATGLALPFFALALFPSFLGRMPRSGGWLPRVKIVLGFVVLAWMFKYLSSVDQVLQWNVLTRERFLAAWFVLFLLAGFYLLGLLKLSADGTDEPVGTGRMLAGAAFLIFSFSLLPGMFGASLGEVDAFVPLATQSSASPIAGARGPAPSVWMKNDLEGATAKARAEGKQVLVSFTGYACTNCHWMKANMFTKPEIAAQLSQFVLVELYTDGTDEASERNQQFQESRFGTASIPFYAILDTDQNVRASFANLTRDTRKFLSFLQTSPVSGTA